MEHRVADPAVPPYLRIVSQKTAIPTVQVEHRVADPAVPIPVVEVEHRVADPVRSKNGIYTYITHYC